jgi:hypothetical protein
MVALVSPADADKPGGRVLSGLSGQNDVEVHEAVGGNLFEDHRNLVCRAPEVFAQERDKLFTLGTAGSLRLRQLDQGGEVGQKFPH